MDQTPSNQIATEPSETSQQPSAQPCSVDQSTHSADQVNRQERSQRLASGGSTGAATNFSFTQARSLIGDLTKPDPKIYFRDFLLTIVSGYLCLIALVHLLPPYWPQPWMMLAYAVTYCATVALFMRAVMFIHELVHLPKEGFGAFRFTWNLLCGIPFLAPSFLYYPHVDHHRRKHYGTDHDGEYLPLSHRNPLWLVGFVVQALVIPVLALIRFGLLSPICWLIPGARKFVHRHASTMLVDPFYERQDGSAKVMRIVVLQEFFCFLVTMRLIFGHKIIFGTWYDPLQPTAFAVAVGLLILNELRTLGAHRWTNEGDEMSFEAQMLDSVNYPENSWITELWGPVGTRFHALHHLFPRLPYHSMPEAHRRLMEGLPEDSPYRKTNAKSLTKEIWALWKRASTRAAAE